MSDDICNIPTFSGSLQPRCVSKSVPKCSFLCSLSILYTSVAVTFFECTARCSFQERDAAAAIEKWLFRPFTPPSTVQNDLKHWWCHERQAGGVHILLVMQHTFTVLFVPSLCLCLILLVSLSLSPSFLPLFSLSSLSQKPPPPLPCLHPHTSIPPFSVSLSVSMLPPCLRLSLPLFAFNSWGHPGPLGSYPRMLSRLTSCGVAFWTEQTAEPGLDRCSDSTMYSAAAPPRKKGDLQRFFG